MCKFWTVLLFIQVLWYLMQGVLLVLACQDSLLCSACLLLWLFGYL